MAGTWQGMYKIPGRVLVAPADPPQGILTILAPSRGPGGPTKRNFQAAIFDFWGPEGLLQDWTIGPRANPSGPREGFFRCLHLIYRRPQTRSPAAEYPGQCCHVQVFCIISTSQLLWWTKNADFLYVLEWDYIKSIIETNWSTSLAGKN